MITVDDLSLQYSGAPLFSKVNLQFTPGNCYGINGAGKSTFLKILSGQLEPSTGSVYIDPKARMSVLKQDQTMYDAYTVMDTVIMGNQRLYDCGKEKDAIYAKDERTASAPPSSRRSLPISAAGRRSRMHPASCRGSASRRSITRR